MAEKKPAASPGKKPNRYSAIVGTIFKRHYRRGETQFDFSRDEFVGVAKSLGIALPKNLGDTIYSFRFRTALPPEIVATIGRSAVAQRFAASPNVVAPAVSAALR